MLCQCGSGRSFERCHGDPRNEFARVQALAEARQLALLFPSVRLTSAPVLAFAERVAAELGDDGRGRPSTCSTRVFGSWARASSAGSSEGWRRDYPDRWAEPRAHGRGRAGRAARGDPGSARDRDRGLCDDPASSSSRRSMRRASRPVRRWRSCSRHRTSGRTTRRARRLRATTGDRRGGRGAHVRRRTSSASASSPRRSSGSCRSTGSAWPRSCSRRRAGRSRGLAVRARRADPRAARVRDVSWSSRRTLARGTRRGRRKPSAAPARLPGMHVEDDRLLLSPSDVTAFLACEHLTTLSLAHARGELERPAVENEQAELIFRKGHEHERAYLDVAARGGQDDPRDRARARTTGRTRGARDRGRRSRDGVDVVYQGVFVQDGWRGDRRLPDARSRDGTGYEALDTKLARHAKPAYILQLLLLQRAARRGCRAASRSGSTCCSAPASRQSFRPGEFGAYYRRVRAPARALRRRPAGDRAATRRALRHLRLQAALRRALGRRRPPLAASRASPARRSSGSARPGSRRSPGSAARRASPLRRESRPTRGRSSASRPSSSSGRASTAGDRYVLLQPQPETRLRAPARAVAGRPLLRLRGQPVLGRRRQPRVPLGDPRRRGELHAAARPRPRERAARVRDVRRPRPRAARALPATCTSTTTRSTRSPRSAADGPLRHARGRARRSAAPRRLRRPLQGRPERRCARRGPATG